MRSDLRREELRAAGFLVGRMLEWLGITRAYVRSVGVQGEEVCRAGLPLNYGDCSAVEFALLEAERHKAEAVAQARRQQFI